MTLQLGLEEFDLFVEDFPGPFVFPESEEGKLEPAH